ncbi:MAG TPA: magnesium/cobalt transporter CorA [Burkholderiales bacterium]|nr:magnesium/cobalt transporter CorA [Burkholderiales bacterium]
MLVNCAAYQDGKKLGDIKPEEISAYVSRPECFVWVALKDPQPGELEVLQKEFDLHELAVEDARHGHQRPKIEEYGNSLFAVLHNVEVLRTPESPDELRVGEVDLFAGRNYILSVRNQAEPGFKDVRARCEREPELLKYGSGFVLYALIDAVVDRYFPVLDAIEDEFEKFEDQIFSGKSLRANIEGLYYVRQKLTLLQHAVLPLLEAVGKLYGGRVPQVCLGMQEYYRDVYDHLVRISQTINSQRDTVTTAIQVNVAMITFSETEVTKRLAAWGALIAVPTFIASLYGMNFRHMPELEWVFGYPAAVGAMALINVLLFFRFRRAGWL